MNMSHLSDEVETVFERLADHDLRSACTPFLIYRAGPATSQFEGLLARVALAASFHQRDLGSRRALLRRAVLQPEVDCRPTLARPGTRDEYSARVGRRSGQRGPLRLPALLAARQRPPLAPVRGRMYRWSRSPARTPPSPSSRMPPEASTSRLPAVNAVILLSTTPVTAVERRSPAEALGARLPVLRPTCTPDTPSWP